MPDEPICIDKLPLSLLWELIWETPDLCEITLQSRICPDFPVKVIRREIGLLLQAKDKDEHWFKVFVYDTHAELWMAKQWRDSNSRYILSKRNSEEERIKSAIRVRRRQLVTDFMSKNSSLPINAPHVRNLITAIAACRDAATLKAFNFPEEIIRELCADPDASPEQEPTPSGQLPSTDPVAQPEQEGPESVQHEGPIPESGSDEHQSTDSVRWV